MIPYMVVLILYMVVSILVSLVKLPYYLVYKYTYITTYRYIQLCINRVERKNKYHKALYKYPGAYLFFYLEGEGLLTLHVKFSKKL